MRQTNFKIKSILTGCSIVAVGIFFVSCKKGYLQNPVPAIVRYDNPAMFVSLPNQVNVPVNVRSKIKVVTTDANYNPVNYQGSPIITNHYRDQYNYLAPQFTKELSQPQGATHLMVEIEVETRECGWPNPNNNNPAEMIYEYQSPILTYPANINVYKNNYSVIYIQEC